MIVAEILLRSSFCVAFLNSIVDIMSDTAHSLVQAVDADIRRSNEQVDIEDAADRAERKRKHGTQRVPLHHIGFWPANRGGVGVSSTHIPEVCADIKTNKVRRQRYEPLQLLAVPEGPMLQKFNAANKACYDSTSPPEPDRVIGMKVIGMKMKVAWRKVNRRVIRLLQNMFCLRRWWSIC